MAKSRTTLTQKLFGYYFALSLTTIFILSIYSYFTSKNALISRTYDQLNSVKFEKERNLENYFLERMDEANQLSRYENWEGIIGKKEKPIATKMGQVDFRTYILSEYKEKIKKHFGGRLNYKNIIIKSQWLNLVIQLDDSLSQEDIIFPEHYAANFDTQLKNVEKTKRASIIDDIAYKKIYVGAPIINNITNLNEGVILLEMDMTPINSIMFNTNILNGLGKTGEAYVVGMDKKMKTSSRFKSNSINTVEVTTTAVENAFNNSIGTGEYRDYRDITVLGSFGKINIPGLHWVILVEIDLEEAMIPIYTLRNSIIILSLITAIIIFGIVYIISRRVSAPIIRLKLAANAIAQGKFDVKLNTTSTDEIGDLTRAFNQMATKIKMQTDEIQVERAKRITSVIDGQEQERQRLSRELHDGLGQRILAVKMKLERAENAGDDLKVKIIEDAKNLLIEVSMEVVSMSENLMPPVLTQFGLISAIENLCEDIRTANDIGLTFHYNTIPNQCADNIKIYLYRIIQEALNNIVKHAEATQVDISFVFEPDSIKLTIADNGNGFDSTHKRKSGNGIYNMRDRAEILGGTFRLISTPGVGTIIEVLLKNKV